MSSLTSTTTSTTMSSIQKMFTSVEYNENTKQLFNYVCQQIAFGKWNTVMDFTFLVRFYPKSCNSKFYDHIVELKSLSIFTDFLSLKKLCIEKINIQINEDETTFVIEKINGQIACIIPEWFFITFAMVTWCKKVGLMK
jgi:hypothetical protein